MKLFGVVTVVLVLLLMTGCSTYYIRRIGTNIELSLKRSYQSQCELAGGQAFTVGNQDGCVFPKR